MFHHGSVQNRRWFISCALVVFIAAFHHRIFISRGQQCFVGALWQRSSLVGAEKLLKGCNLVRSNDLIEKYLCENRVLRERCCTLVSNQCRKNSRAKGSSRGENRGSDGRGAAVIVEREKISLRTSLCFKLPLTASCFVRLRQCRPRS